MLGNFLNQPKSRNTAVLLALLSTILPFPIAGIHKFYLGQFLWGGIYVLLWQTPIPRIACAIEAVWYFVQDQAQFDHYFNSAIAPQVPHAQNPNDIRQVNAIAEALRQLEQLRQEGLMSEYEFEQKRRQLLDRIS